MPWESGVLVWAPIDVVRIEIRLDGETVASVVPVLDPGIPLRFASFEPPDGVSDEDWFERGSIVGVRADGTEVEEAR